MLNGRFWDVLRVASVLCSDQVRALPSERNRAIALETLPGHFE
jgi:hypothetical protein